MKSMIGRTTLREIKESLGRYMAILAIVALGVGFFTGLKVTKPAMLKAGAAYMNGNDLYDLRLLSTIGFDEKDVKRFEEQDGVKAAEGAVYTDFLAADEKGQETVLTAHSLSLVQNQVTVRKGRLPGNADECVVDANAFGTDVIGTKIRIAESNDEDTLELFAYREYTVVGLCDASFYTNYERGTTSLGNGKVRGFVYIPESGFDTDYYMEIFIRLNEDFSLYSAAYEAYIDEAEEWAEPLCEEAARERYNRIKGDAEASIEDGERELNEKLSDARRQLADARQELDDGRQEIEDARQEIADGKKQLADARREIADQEKELADAQAEVTDGEEQLADGQRQIDEKRAEKADMDQDEADALETGLKIKQAQVNGVKAQLQAASARLKMGKGQLEQAKKTVEAKQKELEEGEADLLEAEKELADGEKEYQENEQKLEDEERNARQELADARQELADLEEPDTYVFGRDKNIGYASFENDSDIVEGIAGVFPIFFFLVAVLVCITTMTRMVEEQRTQIGVFKALGYSEAKIMGKYLVYSGSAAVVGCIVGFAAGSVVFPKVIWSAYKIMYTMDGIELVFEWKLAVISLAVSVLCSMGTTIAACRYELMSVAAELMRPKSPKAGKRIILERIPFIWNHMKFLVKVSARNIFRYKQRFFMMVIGIGGCTALLLTGFGVRDSISNIGEVQFDEIQIYDMSVIFSHSYAEKAQKEFEEVMEENGADYMVALEKTMDLTGPDGMKSVTVVVPQDTDGLENFLSLHTQKKEPIPYPGDGEVVLTDKVAGKCGIGVGDTVTLQDDDMNTLELRVSAISENFVYNYAYLTADTWMAQVGKEPEYKSAYVNRSHEMDAHQLSASIMKCKEVASVSVNEDTKKLFSSMLESLDYVVLLIIVCAGALAFIVLYNLTNINITERLREIATIKVLGFYPGETAQYVFRENMALTAFGAAAGLVMGHFLHRFVMYKIDIDMIKFDVRISPWGFVYSILLTFVFAGIVDAVMYLKLDKINMAESMKSIE